MKPNEHEILSILQEECAEVIQAVSKVFRFGFDACHPSEFRNNRQRLEEELGDLQAMIFLLIENGIVSKENLHNAEQQKFTKLEKWSTIFSNK